jgi:hypothetical protein
MRRHARRERDHGKICRGMVALFNIAQHIERIRSNCRLILFGYLLLLFVIGLWPFTFRPINNARLTPDNGLRFERPGTAYTSMPPGKLRDLTAFTIAMRLTTDSSGLSSFEKIFSYALTQPEANFILGQWKDGLGMHLRADGQSQEIHFGSYGVLRKDARACFVISYDGNALHLYENGTISKTRDVGALRFKTWEDSYPLVMGTDAHGNSQWRGTIYEIAVYDRALAPEEVQACQGSADAKVAADPWPGGSERNQIEADGRQPTAGYRKSEAAEEPWPVIHYVFAPENTYATEFRGGKALAVRDLGRGPAADLVVPEYFMPYQRAYLGGQNDWMEYKSNWLDVAVNILGFMPLGVLLMCWLTGRGMSAVMALCMAVSAGFVVSFGVEYLQAFLPSRDSSLRDLITNSAGTLIGSIGYWGIGKWGIRKNAYSAGAISR